MRRIIESENRSEENLEENKPCYDWEPEDWDLYKEAINRRQDELCDLEIIDVLGRVISHD